MVSEIQREYQAIKHRAGFCHLNDRLVIRVSGDDRVSFLHGMCTADIKGMATGQVAPALFVTEHSHVVAGCFVYALADALLIELEREAWARVRAHLEKFLVADEVEMDELAWSVVDVEGPAGASILAETLGVASPPAAWRFDPETLIARFPRFGEPAFTMLLPAEQAARVLPTLRSESGLTELGSEVLDIIRIEHGIARVGADTTEKTLALEARFDWAISFDKGCYIGQETIERATARGGLKRKLYGLRIDGDLVPGVGSSIMLAEKPVGVLTSVTRSPEFGVIGLAILHHSAWNEGAPLAVDGDPRIKARVAMLPFRNS
jgi:folate-binding protein YgfZ